MTALNNMVRKTGAENRSVPVFGPGFPVFLFVGGHVNTTPHVYVHGLVRQGRSTEVKQALMGQMLEEIVRIAGITVEDVRIYLQDIPASQMIEFGRLFCRRQEMKLNGKAE